MRSLSLLLLTVVLALPVDSPAAPSEEVPRRVSLFGTSLRLGNVLEQITRPHGMRLVVQHDVNLNQEIRVPTLQDVDIKAALRTILKPLEYSFEIRDDELLVFARALRTFAIRLSMVEQTWSSEVSNEASSGGSSSGGGASTGATSLGARVAVTATASSSNLWAEVDATLKTIVGDSGTFSVSRGTGLIMVRADPDTLEAVERYVDAVNAEMSRHAVIEVRIAEVRFDDGKRAGVDWNALVSRLGSLSLGGLSIGTTQALAATGEPGAFAFRLSGVDGSAVLRALEEQGDVDVFSQPNLLVANNMPAGIQVGTMEAYVSSIQQTAVAQAGASQTSVETGVLSDGLVLSVVPRIFGDGSMSLAVSTVLQEKLHIDSVSFQGGSVQLPSVIRRSYAGIVGARMGETLVIGGMLERRKSTKTRGVPVLSSFPLIGPLFGFSDDQESRAELVILMTPRGVETAVPKAGSLGTEYEDDARHTD